MEKCKLTDEEIYKLCREELSDPWWHPNAAEVARRALRLQRGLIVAELENDARGNYSSDEASGALWQFAQYLKSDS